MSRAHHARARRPLAAVLAVLLAGAAVIYAAAQENLGRGRIAGQVTDEVGIPVEGAKVTARSLQGNASLEAMTDKQGKFVVAGLGSGAWRITASKQGYADAFTDMNVSQLKNNPPVGLKVRKLAGVEGLRADRAGLDLVDQANSLIDQGNYDGALALLQEFQAKYPDLYQVRLNVAAAYLKKGESDKAEAEYKGLLEEIRQVHGDLAKDKTISGRALAGLGEIALKKGDLAAGQEYLSQALALSPEDEAAAYNVGEILFSNQRADEAVKYFELALQINKDWPKPYYKLGFVYLNKGDYARSLEYFNKFVALDPASPEVPAVKNIIAAIEKMKK